MTVAVDCLWPEPMTPGFLKTMAGWRGQARDFLLESIQPSAPTAHDGDRRQKLEGLIKGLQVIDANAIHLPFDVVARAPSGRDVDLVRHQVMAVVADLVAIELRVRALPTPPNVPVAVEELLGSTASWIGAEPDLAGGSLDGHVGRSRTIAAELEAERDLLEPTPTGVVPWERGLLSRLADVVRNWCDLLLTLSAVETGRPLPPRLKRVALGVKPVRSVDYLGTVLNLAPLTLAMTACSVLWYLTAWDSGPTALLFSFAGCIFLVG